MEWNGVYGSILLHSEGGRKGTPYGMMEAHVGFGFWDHSPSDRSARGFPQYTDIGVSMHES